MLYSALIFLPAFDTAWVRKRWGFRVLSLLCDVSLAAMGQRLVSLLFYLWELCFIPSFPHVGVVLFPSPDGTGLGNVFRGGGMLSMETFKSRFLHYSCPPLLSPYPPFSLSFSPSFSLSSFLSLSLSPSLSFSLCHFFLFPFLVVFALTGCWSM